MVIGGGAWAIAYVAEAAGIAIIRCSRESGVVAELTRLIGVRPAWNATHRGWSVPASAVDDLVALAEIRHQYVTISKRPPKA